MKKLLPLILLPLTLTACTTGNDYRAVEDMRDALSATRYNCDTWEVIDGVGYCTIDGHQYASTMTITHDETPNEWVDFQFKTVPGARNAIVGKNWAFVCDKDMTVDDCDDVVGLLDGEMVSE